VQEKCKKLSILKKNRIEMKLNRLFLILFWLPIVLNGQVKNDSPSGIRPYHLNPHYFSWEGTPVFLLGATGYHSWTPISRPNEVHIDEKLGRLAKVIDDIGSPHVLGFVRCLPYDPMNHIHDGAVKQVLQPWLKTEDGLYDLSHFEPAWEKRLREYLATALKHRIVVSLEIWDDWSVTRGPGGAYDPGGVYGWNGHPFNPKNNINYNETVFPVETGACEAPFYNTIPLKNNNIQVLSLQQKYVDHLLSIATDYPHVIINIANESRAHLDWSQYWARYVRERLPSGFMIGDMPSTNRKDGGGECDYDFNPLILSTDPLYDFVDMAQAVSGHELGSPRNQMQEGGKRILQIRRAMKEKGTIRPLVLSKDYSRDANGGDLVLWSRFFSGAATARFHRPAGDSPEEVVDFQHEAIGRLGRLIAEVPFWLLQPVPEAVLKLPEGAGANVLSDQDSLYMIQLAGVSSGGTVDLQLPLGQWKVKWINPSTGIAVQHPNILSDAPDFKLPVPEGADHMVVVLNKVI
jgi:hypothetical protein